MKKININSLNAHCLFEIHDNDELFAIQDNSGSLVAFSIISKIDKNIIRFYVPTIYRNKHYGKKIFLDSLEYLKDKGMNEFYLYCPEDNYIARKILRQCGGNVEAEKNGETIYYFEV